MTGRVSEAAAGPGVARPPEVRRRAPDTPGHVGGADGSVAPSTAALLHLQRLAGNAAVRRLLVPIAVPGCCVQRVVSPSATYVPQAAATAAITVLDAEVGPAEQDAATALQNPPGGVHTPHQAHYLRHPGPTSWGYCVEERLDPRAAALGWQTQHAMVGGARPDYHRALGAALVFADLTTAAQSNPAGSHITGKLAKVAHQHLTTAAWEAADVLHSGIRPGGGAPPPVMTNGPVTGEHALRFQQYRAYLLDHADYDPGLEEIRKRVGPLSQATFTQVWDEAARDAFVDAFA